MVHGPDPARVSIEEGAIQAVPGGYVVRIAEIESGSIGERLEIEIGSRIVRINGQKVRDGIDLTFLLADPELEMEVVTASGEALVYEVERDPGESLGIVPAPDTVRECANECVFCFIDGNPEGVRESLWLRDDDFRLSFTYGSYVTLTNLGPKGLARLVEQRISPLYVSVHATEPEVRRRLLRNERAGLILEQLGFLLEHGLEVHTQVVLCPEWNDGEHLERTIDDLWGLGPGVRTLSVVPVGLTRYNLNRPVRPLRSAEAAQAVAQVERARHRAKGVGGSADRRAPASRSGVGSGAGSGGRSDGGRGGGGVRSPGWCYAADELFLLAGLPVPPADYYDDGALVENGVGAVRRFLDDFDRGIGGVPRLPGRRLRLLTGLSMAPFLRERAPALADATGADVEVVEVRNSFYGESVTVAGLLAGRDLREAAGEGREGDIVLLPAETLNADDLFIDSLPLEAFRASLAPARVEPAWEVTEALRAL